MQSLLRLRRGGPLAAAAVALSSSAAASESALPAVSAAGRRPAPPPVVLDEAGAPQQARLLSVQVAFRHGARTPVGDKGSADGLVKWAPADTDKSKDLASIGAVELYRHGSGDALSPAELFGGGPQGGFWGGGGGILAGGGYAGQLTTLGLAQSVELGAELRARYVDPGASTCRSVVPTQLLPRSWERAKRLVATRSTCVERTVYTANGVLAGLYPDMESAPIALNGREEDEFMVLNDARSPRLRQLFKQGLRLSSAHLDAAQRACVEAVEAATVWRAHDEEWALISYRDWYACRRAAGKANPPEVEAIAAELDAATAKQMHSIFEGGAAHTADPRATRTEALRLSIGRLMAHVVETLERPDGTLHLYSGHDWTVSPLLMCVSGAGERMLDGWPPFCANVAFELWSTREDDVDDRRQISHHAACGGGGDDGRHVRVLFNSEPVDMPCSPAGQYTCTLAQFKAMVEPFCVKDFDAEGRAAAGADAAAAAKPAFNK